MAREDNPKTGKQEIRLTFDFINHDDPDSSNHNEVVYVDSPDVIGLIEATAIMPGFILICERLNKLAEAKAIKNNPELVSFLTSLSE